MATAKLYALSYAQHRSLGLPVLRPAAYVKARVRPTRRTPPIGVTTPAPIAVVAGRQPWQTAHPRATNVVLGDLGQPGSQVTLPDGTDHTVQAVNTTGEILTTDGWQSATQPDGTERWINVHTGDSMLSTGEMVRAATGLFATLPTWAWWSAGAVAVLGVGYFWWR